MNDKILYIALIYFAVINLLASLLAVIDKQKARKEKWRIPEKTLMLFGFFGGAIGEYITMKIIRHKTQHNKFMIGLPLFILLHIAIVIFSIYLAAK